MPKTTIPELRLHTYEKSAISCELLELFRTHKPLTTADEHEAVNRVLTVSESAERYELALSYANETATTFNLLA